LVNEGRGGRRSTEVYVGISPLSPLTPDIFPYEISFMSLIPPANFFFFKRGVRRELLRTQNILSPLNDYKNSLWFGLDIRKTGLYVKSRKWPQNMREAFRPVFQITMKGCIDGRDCRITLPGRN
jgi:hypothetical protein